MSGQRYWKAIKQKALGNRAESGNLGVMLKSRHEHNSQGERGRRKQALGHHHLGGKATEDNSED